METLKLRKSQEVERLLESYILRSDFLPRDAHRIRSAPSVPKELRGLVMQAVKLGKAWSCWIVVVFGRVVLGRGCSPPKCPYHCRVSPERQCCT